MTVRRRGLRPASIRARIAVVSITVSDADGLDDLDLPRWWVPVAVGALAVLAGILALV